MLRHYDEIGLLRPVRIDPESGYRYYSENQLPAAGRIAALKDMGFGWPPSVKYSAAMTKSRRWNAACLCSGRNCKSRPGRRHTGCGFWTQPWNG